MRRGPGLGGPFSHGRSFYSTFFPCVWEFPGGPGLGRSLPGPGSLAGRGAGSCSRAAVCVRGLACYERAGGKGPPGCWTVSHLWTAGPQVHQPLMCAQLRGGGGDLRARPQDHHQLQSENPERRRGKLRPARPRSPRLAPRRAALR